MRLEEIHTMHAAVQERAETYPAELQSFMRQFLTERAFMSEGALEGARYATYQDLLLDLGTLRTQDYFVPDDDVFYDAQEAQQCFSNAYRVVLDAPDRYTYVEGKACAGLLIVNHAWVEDADGTIIDPTWATNLDERFRGRPVYYGIRFSSDFVLRRVIETGWTSILNREWEYDFPALRRGFTMQDGLAVDFARTVERGA